MYPLIIVEGPDGVGKSTLAANLADRLVENGTDMVYQCREPGSTSLGERIRSIVLDPDESVCLEAQFHMFMAARAQLYTHVGEQLAICPVVMDRGWASSIAYQCYGQKFSVSAAVPAISYLLNSLIPFKAPIFNLFLTAPKELRDERMSERAGKDRYEGFDDQFQERMATGYQVCQQLAETISNHANHVFEIDASGTEQQVLKDALDTFSVVGIL